MEHKNLYECYTKATGIIYVVATDPTSAQREVENRLNESNYGFSDDQKVTEIKIIARELEKRNNENGYRFSKRDINLIIS